MRNIYILALSITILLGTSLMAELPETLNLDEYPYFPHQVAFPKNLLKSQILFVGGEDMVQTWPTYGNPAAKVPAKQWHDFIGFTPTKDGETGLGWISTNHEMQQANDNIGDGGGMTVYKIDWDVSKKEFVILDQTIGGQTSKFFNVDFVNTVGETGMNCGGIVSGIDGRIWTAEEWQVTSNNLVTGRTVGRDTSDFTIGTGTANGQAAPNGFNKSENNGFDGKTIKKFENINFMVEIDPRTAKAIRKQYNWGRQWFEGGVILPDNKTVILGVDDTPAYLSMFVATTAGDFTKGDLYIFKQNVNDTKGKWVKIANGTIEDALAFSDNALKLGGTMFNRLEWIAFDKISGKVFVAETGADDAGRRWIDEYNESQANSWGARPANHHWALATAQGKTSPSDTVGGAYADIYGRVLMVEVSDLTTNTPEVTTFIEGGPFYNLPGAANAWANQEYIPYPAKHLASPDGLLVMQIKGKSYLVIQEDLIGRSFGRVHPGVNQAGTPVCETWMLPLSANPTTAKVDDLIRIAATPIGAEVTGACAVYDKNGNTLALLINSQHPSTFNEYPFNNSVTVALTGWDDVIGSIENDGGIQDDKGLLKVFPNPTSQMLNFDAYYDAALYNNNGDRVKVVRNQNYMDVRDLALGTYYLKFDTIREIQKVVIAK